MELGISNIAWDTGLNESVYSLMKKYNFSKLEIAPTKLFGMDPYITPENKINLILDELNYYSIKVSSLQSLLYGQNQLKVFDSSSINTSLYLEKSIVLAKDLGANVVIFGSPKNRIYCDEKNYLKDALNFFIPLGEKASLNSIKFCLEVNPTNYGTNFLTSLNELLAFLEKANIKGLGLHIDLGAMLLNNEDFNILSPLVSKIDHIHLSLPFLENINKYNISYFSSLPQILKDYKNCISIEMKEVQNNTPLNSIEESLYLTSNLFSSIIS